LKFFRLPDVVVLGIEVPTLTTSLYTVVDVEPGKWFRVVA